MGPPYAIFPRRFRSQPRQPAAGVARGSGKHGRAQRGWKRRWGAASAPRAPCRVSGPMQHRVATLQHCVNRTIRASPCCTIGCDRVVSKDGNDVLAPQGRSRSGRGGEAVTWGERLSNVNNAMETPNTRLEAATIKGLAVGETGLTEGEAVACRSALC